MGYEKINNIKLKKKIIVDLDVTTVAFWDNKDEAKLIAKIKSGMFFVITPYVLIDHLSKWNHRKLADQITNFYDIYSSHIVSAQNILDKMRDLNADYGKLLMELVNLGVKEEDVILVIVSGIFNADYLVTFNRKHLKSKEKEINGVLSKNGIGTIKIVFPKEL